MNLQVGPARQWRSHRATLASGGGFTLSRLRRRPVARVAEPLGRPSALRRYAAPNAQYSYKPPSFVFFFFQEIVKSPKYSYYLQI